ncbi:response regulator transcription factor [Kribbella steppae]|uniref:response regulator transcription factor n=1 Tax=Kribbella steppae TaxID=2512223 RepID=UPI00272D0D9F|nr:helix-turn-helix transcriptional regulator [Kribbella steppae]
MSAREREVLIQVARGLSNADIARTLHLAEATVRTHIGHVVVKTAARDRAYAVVFAYESGLVHAG